MLHNAFSFDQDGNLIQFDELLSKRSSIQPTPPTPPEPVDPDVIGGRKYKTTKIGDQTWLAENLDLKWDGLSIKLSSTATSLDELPPEAVYFNNDEDTYGVNGKKYGLLYNFAAVKYLNDHRDTLIPGWRVPSSEDFDTLKQYLTDNQEDKSGFSTYYIGKDLCALDCWTYQPMSGPPPYTSAPTDKYGFSAVPSGYGSISSYSEIECCRLWSSTQTSSLTASPSDLKQGILLVNMSGSYDDTITNQYTIRLIKDE